MKKIENLIICLIVILGLTLIVVLYFFFDSLNKQDKKEELKNCIDSAEITKLQDRINALEEQNHNVLSRNCRYIKTYYFVDYYDYQGDIPTDKYIIVDKYQEHNPIIIKYNTNDFDIVFEKGSNYEFTFTSIIEKGIESKKTIVDIRKTDRLGMDQIQESCYYHE